MSLRTAILKAAIPHIPEQGFTRAALNTGLASLPSSATSSSSASSASSSAGLDEAGRDAVIDTLFGSSSASDAPRALVQAWEDEGRSVMHVAGKGSAQDRLLAVLGRRLEWSAGVGEHLVDVRIFASSDPTSLLSTPPSSLVRSSLPVRPLCLPSFLSSLTAIICA